MDQSLTILLTLIGSLKANLLNVQIEVLWHQRCSIQVKSFSSIFPFKNPTGAPQGAPFLPLPMSGCECKPDAKRKRDSAQPQDRAQPSRERYTSIL